MEARHCHAELEQTLGAPVFLDSDDLTDLRELLDQVRESDVLLFFQSRSVLTRPYCLLELHTAVTAGVPIVAVNVRGGNEYSHADAAHLLRYLDTELEVRNPGASRLLQKHGVDLTELAHTLSGIVPNLISIEFNPSGSRLNLAASLLDIAQTMRIAKPAALDEAEEGRQAWLTARSGSPTARRSSSYGAVHAHGGRAAAVAKSSSLAPVPFEVPELPGHHEPRPAFMTRLKRALGAELSAEEEASEAEACEHRSEAEEAAAQGAARAEAQAAEASGRVTVVGMGGAGKTSIATAVARDASVRSRFERVLWVTLGQAPNLTHLQGVLCKQLTDEELTGGVSPEAARAQLARAAQGRRVLLLLDDLWDPAHERPLAILELGLPAGSRCLITTRIRGRFKGVELDLGSMAPPEALRLLTTYYLLPTTHYLLLTTEALRLLTTYYLLPTTYYLLLTTHYLLPRRCGCFLLTTYYLLLTTYYLLIRRRCGCCSRGRASRRCARRAPTRRRPPQRVGRWRRQRRRRRPRSRAFAAGCRSASPSPRR